MIKKYTIEACGIMRVNGEIKWCFVRVKCYAVGMVEYTYAMGQEISLSYIDCEPNNFRPRELAKMLKLAHNKFSEYGL
jgi:hypothetical protein